MMGYTHYWYRTPSREAATMFGRYAIDAVRLIDVASMSGIDLEATLTEGYILLNGVGAEACENFWWPAIVDPSDGGITGECFEFTKTRLRPYDAVVTALLLRARVVYDGTGMRFASDGTWDARPYGEGNWLAGRDLYVAAFGEPFPTRLEPHEIP